MGLSTTVDVGGGQAPTTSNFVTTSIASGDFVTIVATVRNGSSPALSISPALTGQALRTTGSADFNGNIPVVYTGVMPSTGSLTITPLQSSASFWAVVVFRGTNLTYLDADAEPQGVFNASPSFGPSSAMSAAGGVAIGALLSGAGDAYDITNPTGAPTANLPNNGAGRAALSYGTQLRTSGQTVTVTGTQTLADVGVVNAFWVLLEDAAPPTPTASGTPTDGDDVAAGAATAAAPTYIPQNLNATALAEDSIGLTWDAVAGISRYAVERDGVIIDDDVATNSFTDTGLTPSTLYSYYVRSVIP